MKVEHYKMLMKEILKDSSKWGDIPCSRSESLDIEKMSVLPQFDV